MISSASSPDRGSRPEAVAAGNQVQQRPLLPRPDRISTENAAFLREALVRQPEVRPEVVDRAKMLAKDPNYPPADVLNAVAQRLLASPDLSESEA